MVKNETVVKLLEEAGCVPYFKETCTSKSIELVVHPNLLTFLKKSGITDNNIINKLLGPSKIKAAYFNNKHINFISIFIEKGEPMLNYINFDSIKKEVRGQCHEHNLTDERVIDLKTMLPTVRRASQLFSPLASSRYHDIEYFTKNSDAVETVKLGKGINKLFNKNDPKDVEQFVDIIKAAQKSIDNTDNIDIVSGQEIQFYYNEHQYAARSEKSRSTDIFVNMAVEQNIGGCGELGNSCMKFQNCSRGIKFYAANPGTISLLVYRMEKPSTRIKGRAILWKGMNNITYIDRIYGTDKNIMLAMAAYAQKNGFVNCSPSNRKVLPYQKDIVIKVKLEKWHDMELPFLDSMKCINLQKGIISNWVYNDNDNFVRGSYTFGEHFTKRVMSVLSELSGIKMEANEAVQLTYGKHKGKRCHFSESAYIRWLNKYVALEEVTEENFVIGTCNIGPTLIPKDDAIKDFNKEYIPEIEARYLPSMDVYALDINDIFLDKKVTVQPTLIEDCIRANIDYIPEMKRLIDRTDVKVLKEAVSDSGVYVKFASKVFIIPFQSLRLK